MSSTAYTLGGSNKSLIAPNTAKVTRRVYEQHQNVIRFIRNISFLKTRSA
jgi:hypothetical protein